MLFFMEIQDSVQFHLYIWYRENQFETFYHLKVGCKPITTLKTV
jgi:hypothetical protein